MHVPKVQRSKLAEKSVECIMIGYSEQSKGYRLYNPATKKVVVSRDVTFIEPDTNEVISLKRNRNNRHVSSAVSSANISSGSSRNTTDNSSSDSSSEDSDTDSESDDDFSEAIDDPEQHLPQTAANIPENQQQNPIEDDLSPKDVKNDANTTNIESSEATNGYDMNSSFAETDFDVVASEISTVPAPFISLPDVESDNGGMNHRKTLGLHALLAAAIEDESEPTTFKQAINCSAKTEWKKSMLIEYESLLANDTWKLCELPVGRKAIDSKWVYKIKRNAIGEIERYKARLVIKGYSQVKGIDYDETYSPVARYSSIRFLLAMAAKFNMIIHQMDAVTAFLQGELSEEIYMQQPDGFNDKSGKVCRLNRALYGLKQSSRIWNDKLNDVLLCKLKFLRSTIDQCIYFKHSEMNTIILAVWVDDIMIFSSNATMCTKLKYDLSLHFHMKDLGEVKTLLGMNITRHTDGSISIDQQRYISSIIKRFNMENCNPIDTPMDPNQKLSKEMCPKTDAEQQEMANIPFQEAIGCIMYAAQISRPDICFAVGVLSRYNTNYGRAHWTAVKRVLRYLKGTIDMKLTFQPGDIDELIGYCDADWAGDLDKRRSTTGYMFQAQGGAISWATRSQPTIALSSTEAEFMSMVAAIQEALWLKRFESEIFLDAPKTIILYCDNQGALHLAKNKNYHSRTKHIDVRKYFIQENLHHENNPANDIKMKLLYKPTNEMAADIMTKAVNHIKLNKFIPQFGLYK